MDNGELHQKALVAILEHSKGRSGNFAKVVKNIAEKALEVEAVNG